MVVNEIIDQITEWEVLLKIKHTLQAGLLIQSTLINIYVQSLLEIDCLILHVASLHFAVQALYIIQ